MNRIRLFALLLLLQAAVASCGGKVETLTFGSPDAAEKVLIVLEPSEYKLQLARELAKALDNGSRYIVVTGLEALKKTDPAQYRAVIILNAIKAGKPDAKASRFVGRYPDAGNIIVVNTWGGEPEKLEMEADTLSSASKTEEIPGITAMVLQVLGF